MWIRMIRIFFDALLCLDIDRAALAQGALVLGYLISLGKVRVKIVFPGEDTCPRDTAADGESEPDAVINHLAVQHRQGAGHSHAYRTGAGVGR